MARSKGVVTAISFSILDLRLAQSSNTESTLGGCTSDVEPAVV